MMASDFIVDVTETDFEYEVVAYSQNTPVVVDFWAVWCQPCKQLTPILEELAREGKGEFRLARVNVDENPNLALRYGVRSIPTVKAFGQGQVVAEFVGLQPEPRIREFIERLMPPSQVALAIEKANSYLSIQEWAGAEKLFRDLEKQDPNSAPVKLGLVKSILAQGRGGDAAQMLHDFPASKEYTVAEKLRPLCDMLVRYDQGQLPNENDQDATFRSSLRLARRGNLEAAMDGLLDLLRQDRRYRNNSARQVIVAILELFAPEDEMARQYRNELATVLF